MQEKLQRLLSAGKEEEVIQTLLVHTRNDQNLHHEVVIQSARFEAYKKDKRMGTTSFEQQNIALAKIRTALLEIIERLSGEATRTMQKSTLIEITIAGEVSEFNKSKQSNLVNVIAAILGIATEMIVVKKVLSGSVKIIIELPTEKAEELIRLYQTTNSKSALLKQQENITNIQPSTIDRQLKNR